MGLNSTSGRLSRSELRRKIHPDDLPGIKIEFDALLAGDKNNSRIAFRQKNKKDNTSGGSIAWWCSMVLFRILSSILRCLPKHTTPQRCGRQNWLPHATKPCSPTDLKTAFLANMSHEIRTPLNSIVGFGLAEGDSLVLGRRGGSLSIQSTKTVNCCFRWLVTFFDMSRIESGAMDFQIAECNLSLLVDEVYQSQRFNIPPAVSLLKNVPLHEEKQILGRPGKAQTDTK